jgi:exopolysaccharide biosynthesis polyprenyl glycosylphosphotransferase
LRFYNDNATIEKVLYNVIIVAAEFLFLINILLIDEPFINHWKDCEVVSPLIKNCRIKLPVLFLISLVLFMLHLDLFGHIWNQFYSHGTPFLQTAGRWLVYSIYAVLLAVFSIVYNAYQIHRLKPMEIVYSQILSLFFTNLIAYFQLCLIHHALLPAKGILGLLGVQSIFSVIWAVFADKLCQKLFPPESIAVVFGERSSLEESLSPPLHYRAHFMPTAYIDCRQEEASILRQLVQFDTVLLQEVPVPLRNRLLKFCYAHSITVYMTPNITDILLRSAENSIPCGVPILCCNSNGLRLSQRITKRVLDLLVSMLCILVCLPLMGIIALMVKGYDGGPVLFRQRRCTQGGKIFKILKFRSMVVDAEKDGIFKPVNNEDPRITPVGRFLRNTHFDELPQLFNILRGDMSFVGPRPERVEHVEAYTKEIPEFRYRLKVKGGLTGYAQVMGAYNTNAYDKLKLDLMYIQNYSLFLDLKLILLTLKSIFTDQDHKPSAPLGNVPAKTPQTENKKQELIKK